MCQIFATCYSTVAFCHGTDSNDICTLLFLYYSSFSLIPLSHSISTSLDPALSPSSLSNCPLSSEGWVLMWVYFGIGSGVGCGYGSVVGHGEVGHGLTTEVSGFWWVGSDGGLGWFPSPAFFFFFLRWCWWMWVCASGGWSVLLR